jgi:16S rRNA (cytidine1402-2'-O)-methyltransferase
MSGTLFVVATPIGNLEDITLRALRVLREAGVIAAEDTRRTSKLLTHYSITTPALSFHAHNTRRRIPQLLSRLQSGEKVALVSDAGTPGISDPGIELISACWENGIAIDPVPGPSAPLAAAAASGFPLEPLSIFGFVPTRSKDRKIWWARIQAIPETVTFFEAPHRIEQTLKEAADFCGERPIMVARELTKRHQELRRLNKAADLIGQMPAERGEFTLVVGPASHVRADHSYASDELIYTEFCQLTADGAVGRRAVINTLARKYGQSAKQTYAIIERFKQSNS